MDLDRNSTVVIDWIASPSIIISDYQLLFVAVILSAATAAAAVRFYFKRGDAESAQHATFLLFSIATAAAVHIGSIP